MSAHAIQAEAHDAPGPHDADTQGHRQVLNDLIAMGAGLARFLYAQAAAHAAQQALAQPIQQARDVQQATDAPPAPPSNAVIPDALISLAAAFDRTARAVRRGILLARSLGKPMQPAHDPAARRAAARRRIIREVEDVIQRTGSRASDGQDGADTLHAELRDRLDAPDLDDDIALRPAADIIAELCRDLGLAVPPGSTRPWPRRTPEDIRQLCARAAAPSGARQPGAAPQPPRPSAAPPAPGPQPDHPDQPAASPRPQPGSIHPRSDPPDDPASTLATILRHPAPVHGRWRPPPQA